MMLYRMFPRGRHDISILGFGCMRLPTEGDQQAGGKVDEQKATDMIRTAIDGGVNNIDAAYHVSQQGERTGHREGT